MANSFCLKGVAETVERLLKEGETLTVLPISLREKGVWMDFMGRPASCHKVSAYALTTRANVVVIAADITGKCFHSHLTAELLNCETLSSESATIKGLHRGMSTTRRSDRNAGPILVATPAMERSPQTETPSWMKTGFMHSLYQSSRKPGSASVSSTEKSSLSFAPTTASMHGWNHPHQGGFW